MSSAVQHVSHGQITTQEIPLGYLHESKHNPRRHFDDKAMEELVASIRQVGIIEALVVRSNQQGYEIASGHRRYRAAVQANLQTVPCRVLELTDQQFMEILTISNLQREDVHPLDEARGYEALMAAPYRMKAMDIATKVGKSEKYIYDSKKLLELHKAAQQLFWDGVIEKGHAILLARLTPAEQGKVIGTEAEAYSDGGLLHPERDLYDDDHEGVHLKACSVRELEDYIKRHIRFSAKQADQFLFPETVSQVTAATETKGKIIEITREYLADDDVRHADSAKVYGSRGWKRADGKEESDTCERSVLGVIVSGPGQGEAFKVCVNKDRCLVHWGKEIRAREKRRKEVEKTGHSHVADAKEMKQRELERQRQEQEKEKRDHWEKVTGKIQEAVVERVKTLPATSLGFLGELLVKDISGRLWRKTKLPAMPRGKTAEDLVRYLGALVLVDNVQDFNAHEQFPPVARAIGVDLSPFVKEVQTSAGKGKKGKKA